MKNELLTLLMFSLSTIFSTLTFGQSINDLNTKIDSLKSVENSFKNKINALVRQIERLEQQKLAMQIKENMNETGGHKTSIVNDAELKSEPDPFSKTVALVPKGSEIIIFHYKSAYWMAEYKNNFGYIMEIYIDENDIISGIKDKDVKAKQEKELIERENWQRQKKLHNEKELAKRKDDLIKKYGKKIGENIFQGVIWMGMTKEMVIDSRGRPNDINRTVGEWGVHEQWVYNNTYLYFENGKLTSWQE